jgi:protein arginine kinase activator
MKCDLCPQDATVFLTQIINGQMTTVNLCDACSKAKGVTDTMGFGLAEAFLGGTSTSTGSPSPAAPVSSIPRDACPACGFTYAQLKKIGRMGCPECYTAFREGLDGLLSAMHKGNRHVGKTPTDTAAPLLEPTPEIWNREEAERKIEQLRNQIKKAVSAERYEDAATFKGEIDSLLSRIALEETKA